MNDKLQFTEGITLAGNHYDGPIDVEVTRYLSSDGGLAIVLITREDGYPDLLSKLTINLEGQGETPNPGCVFVKDYSENEGILDAFVKKGWLRVTGRTVRSGYVSVPEAQVIGDLLELVESSL